MSSSDIITELDSNISKNENENGNENENKKIKLKLKIKDKYRISHEQKIEQQKQKIEDFKLLPKYKQGTMEWKNQRNDYLTASTICSAIGESGRQSRKHLLIEKGSRGKQSYFSGNCATQHGNKCEPLANAIYGHKNNVEIEEFGLITNPKYPILGVSPDGIMLDKMLEIKCPYSRKINGVVKKEYYHQMQEQMVVCEYDSCDFLECKFIMYSDSMTDNSNNSRVLSDSKFWDQFDNVEYKGALTMYISDDNNNNEFKYSYSPVIGLSANDLKQWVDNERQNRMVVFVQYWILDIYSCQNIVRDPEWIKKYYPILEEFWNEVVELRENGITQKMLESSESEASDTDEICTLISNCKLDVGSTCLI